MKALARMASALLVVVKAKVRSIGRCPPHRYVNEAGLVTPFCQDCGRYPSAE